MFLLRENELCFSRSFFSCSFFSSSFSVSSSFSFCFCSSFCSFLFSYFFSDFLFIYFWLCWVFIAARGLSLVAGSRGYSSLWCVGFSWRWLLLLRSTGSRHAGSVVVAHGLSSCGSWALECRLSSCGTQA